MSLKTAFERIMWIHTHRALQPEAKLKTEGTEKNSIMPPFIQKMQIQKYVHNSRGHA